MLRYDRVLNAYIDEESGAIIPLEAGEIPHEVESSNELGRETPQMLADRQLAESLARRDRERYTRYGMGNINSIFSGTTIPSPPSSRSPQHITATIVEAHATAAPSQPSFAFADHQNASVGYVQPSSGYKAPVDQDYINVHVNGPYTSSSTSQRQNSAGWDDWTLARTLQMMEFEIAEEVEEDQQAVGDFAEKEVRASNFRRQLMTVSLVICLIQVSQT